MRGVRGVNGAGAAYGNGSCECGMDEADAAGAGLLSLEEAPADDEDDDEEALGGTMGARLASAGRLGGAAAAAASLRAVGGGESDDDGESAEPSSSSSAGSASLTDQFGIGKSSPRLLFNSTFTIVKVAGTHSEYTPWRFNKI